MKARMGFVSNSSSASFVVSTKGLRKSVVNKIRYHVEFAKKMGYRSLEDGDRWVLTEKDDQISGWTRMDNIHMREFLRKIGVPDENVLDYNGHA